MNVLMLVVVPVIILAIVAALVIAQYDISKNNRRGKLVIPILSLAIPIAFLKISGVVIMKSSMLLISVLLFIGVQVAIIGFIIEMVFRSNRKKA